MPFDNVLTSFAAGSLFGVRTGEGPVRVLALHGWGGNHRQMEKLTGHRDAIALDLPGFGASPAPDSAWGAAEYARAVEPVLDEVAEPIVVVGFSFGGRLAVHLAVNRPDKVKALVLTGVPLLKRESTRKAPLAFRAMKLANRAGILSDGRMESERRKRGSADYRAATGVMRDVLVRVVNESYEEQLQQLRCPCDFVWGAGDTDVPVVIAERARTMVPSETTLTVVPGTTHFLPLESPGAINEVIDRRFP